MSKAAAKCVLLFAKWPEPGAVKTRLAADTNAKFAANFYRLCCSSVQLACQSKQWKSVVAFSPEDSQSRFHEWLGLAHQHLSYVPQYSSVDLGRRMNLAIAGQLAAGAQQVVLIGSDIPDIDSSILEMAFTALQAAEIVFGPAKDGGFYLIGATVMPEGLLQGIEWSTDTVLAKTAEQCKAARLTIDISSLPRLQDIDTLQDLHSWLDGADDSHKLKQSVQSIMYSLQSSARHQSEKQLEV